MVGCLPVRRAVKTLAEKEEEHSRGVVEAHLLVVEAEHKGYASEDVAPIHDEDKRPQRKAQADAIVLEVPVVDEDQAGLEKQQRKRLDGLVPLLREVRQAEGHGRREED